MYGVAQALSVAIWQAEASYYQCILSHEEDIRRQVSKVSCMQAFHAMMLDEEKQANHQQ